MTESLNTLVETILTTVTTLTTFITLDPTLRYLHLAPYAYLLRNVVSAPLI